MKKFALLFLLPILALTGCNTCQPSCGWSFQMGRPSTVQSQVLVEPVSTTMYGVQGLQTAAGPMSAVGAYAGPMTNARLAGFAADPCAPGVTASARSAFASDPCNDLADICRRLDQQSQLLQQLITRLPALPLRATPEKIPAPMP